jgi:hypothetical protein
MRSGGMTFFRPLLRILPNVLHIQLCLSPLLTNQFKRIWPSKCILIINVFSFCTPRPLCPCHLSYIFDRPLVDPINYKGRGGGMASVPCWQRPASELGRVRCGLGGAAAEHALRVAHGPRPPRDQTRGGRWHWTR